MPLQDYNNGTLTVTASGGTAPFTFLLKQNGAQFNYGGSNFTNPVTQNGNTITFGDSSDLQGTAGIPSGTYTCQITDANGCTVETGNLVVAQQQETTTTTTTAAPEYRTVLRFLDPNEQQSPEFTLRSGGENAPTDTGTNLVGSEYMPAGTPFTLRVWADSAYSGNLPFTDVDQIQVTPESTGYPGTITKTLINGAIRIDFADVQLQDFTPDGPPNNVIWDIDITGTAPTTTTTSTTTTTTTSTTTTTTTSTTTTTTTTVAPEPLYWFHLGSGVGANDYPFQQNLITGSPQYLSDNTTSASTPEFEAVFADALANPSSYQTINSRTTIADGDQFVFDTSNSANFYWLLIPDSMNVPDLTQNARLADISNNVDDVAAQVLAMNVNGQPYKLYRVNIAAGTAGATIQYNV